MSYNDHYTDNDGSDDDDDDDSNQGINLYKLSTNLLIKNPEVEAVMLACTSSNVTTSRYNRSPKQTQGLVERNNRTAKENLTNILKEKRVSLDTWCLFLGEAAYKKKYQ